MSSGISPPVDSPTECAICDHKCKKGGCEGCGGITGQGTYGPCKQCKGQIAEGGDSDPPPDEGNPIA